MKRRGLPGLKICRLSRPPIQTLFNQFPQTRDFLLKNMEGAGHEVQEFPIKPVKIPNRYLPGLDREQTPSLPLYFP